MDPDRKSADIESEVLDLIAKEGSIDRAKISLEATLKDLDVHSLDAVQIVFAIEDKFDIDVPEDEAQYASATVRQLVDGVIRLLKAKAAKATTAGTGVHPVS